MRLNRGTLIFIVALALIIAAALALLQRGESSSDDAQATPANQPLFADVTADQITSLTVTEHSEIATALEPVLSRLAIEKDAGGSWVVAEGNTLESQQPVQQDKVTPALNTLVGLRYRDSFQATDLAQYGLDSPLKEIAFTAGDTTYQLKVGDHNISGSQYYALLGDDSSTVYVLTSASSADTILNLTQNPPFVPEPTPTPVPVLTLPGTVFNAFNQQLVNQVTITDQASGQQIVLVRNDETLEWSIDGDDSPVDQTLAALAVSDIGFLNAVDGLTVDDLSTLGLDNPAYTITAQQSDGANLNLRIGGQDPTRTRYYALVNDFEEVAVLPASDVNGILDLLVNPPLMPEVTPEATAEAEMTAEATADVEMTEEAGG